MLNKSSLVSIIIPCYNAENFLKECILSALSQTHKNIEIIVIDDGSDDKSLSIAEELEQANSCLKVIQHPNRENKGVSASRQLGIDLAKGDFIAFLDADDRFNPEKIEVQLSRMEKTPECVLSHTGVVVHAGEPKDAGLFEKHFNSRGKFERSYSLNLERDYLENNYICNSSVIVRAAQLRKLNISHPQMFQHEDWALWIKLSFFGKFLFIPDRLTVYRVHSASATELVRTNELVRNYSQIEFLLSVASFADDSKLLKDAMARLISVMANLMIIYSDADKQAVTEALSVLSPEGMRTQILKEKRKKTVMSRLLQALAKSARYIRKMTR